MSVRSVSFMTTAAAAGLLCALPVAAGAADFHWQGRLAAGRTLEVYGVNGAVRAVAASGDETVVDAVKHGRRTDPESVQIKVVEHADGVTVCAVYPSAVGSASECRPGGGSTNVRDNDVEVDFTLHVPAGVRLVARTVNGGIEARGLGGDVDLQTVNGGVQVATAGEAQARTVNGSITASLGRADGTAPLSFSTVNGGITVAVPSSMGAEVSAETVHGAIQTDFPLAVAGGPVGHQLRGAIGGGGRELHLQTVNGSIRLQKTS